MISGATKIEAYGYALLGYLSLAKQWDKSDDEYMTIKTKATKLKNWLLSQRKVGGLFQSTQVTLCMVWVTYFPREQHNQTYRNKHWLVRAYCMVNFGWWTIRFLIRCIIIFFSLTHLLLVCIYLFFGRSFSNHVIWLGS